MKQVLESRVCSCKSDHCREEGKWLAEGKAIAFLRGERRCMGREANVSIKIELPGYGQQVLVLFHVATQRRSYCLPQLRPGSSLDLGLQCSCLMARSQLVRATLSARSTSGVSTPLRQGRHGQAGHQRAAGLNTSGCSLGV